MKVWHAILLAALGGLTGGARLAADDCIGDQPASARSAPAFTLGETLTYKLGWGIFRVADASLTVEPAEYNSEPALRIRLTTRTNAFADAFYKVRNTSTSWVSPELSHALEYHAVQLESTRNRDTVATFDPASLTARYRNNLNGSEPGPVDIEPGTFDPLGIVFHVRSLDFKVGDVIVIPTSNGKEFFNTIVQVRRKVTRKFAIGKREAYVLEPDIKDVGGVFKRSEGGRIRFYFSADADKLPLRMESEVAIGSFWAELTGVAAPAPES